VEGRSLRAVVIIAVALVGLAAASAIYVRPRLSAPAPARPLARAPLEVCDAAFADARHGAVLLCAPDRPREFAYATADGGRTWRSVAADLVHGGRVQWFDAGHGVLEGYGDAHDGVWMTDDGGLTWTARTPPPPPLVQYTEDLPRFADPDHAIQLWYLDQVAPPVVRGPSSVELWRTSDGAATWQRAASRGLPRQGMKQLLRFASPAAGFVAWWPPGDAGWPRLLSTPDGGETWIQEPLPTPAAPPTGVLGAGMLDLGSRLVFWMLTPDLGPPFGVAGRAQLQTSVSADGGLTWSDPREGPYGPGTFPQADGRGAAYLQDGDQLWTSSNGTSWSRGSLRTPPDMHSVRIVSGAGGTLVAGGLRPAGRSVTAALLLSTDAGRDWAQVTLPKPPA
jgi:photosystem II stability/assembly factor-like uncharacterized protein